MKSYVLALFIWHNRIALSVYRIVVQSLNHLHPALLFASIRSISAKFLVIVLCLMLSMSGSPALTFSVICATRSIPRLSKGVPFNPTQASTAKSNHRWRRHFLLFSVAAAAVTVLLHLEQSQPRT